MRFSVLLEFQSLFWAQMQIPIQQDGGGLEVCILSLSCIKFKQKE